MPAMTFMLRILLLAIALIVPTQFAGAGMTSLCQHETDAAQAGHVGHHEHHHPGDKPAKSNGKTTVGDSCGACHGMAMPLLSLGAPIVIASTASARPILPDAATLASVVSRAPDRPQWLRPA
ncbi:hypothetical protein BH09PSE6_BH09PSE6_01560 [soil metagenome]